MKVNCAVIIPVKQVTEQMIDNIQSLLNKKFLLILIVSPKSKMDMRLVKIVKENERCTIFYSENQGSNFVTIKNAIQLLLNQHHDLDGVVTLSRPYPVVDIEKVAEELAVHEHNVILGVGSISDHQIENRFATFLFNIVYGTKLRDIQTGLVAVPLNELECVSEHGPAFFDFEVYVLIQAKQMQNEIVQVPIHQSIGGNQATNFRCFFTETVRTYMTIVSSFIIYSFSTIVAGIVDIALFSLLSGVILVDISLKSRIFFATFISRILSSFCDFSISRKYAFGARNTLTSSIMKYYVLWFSLLSVSSLLVYLCKQYIGSNLVISKLFIDLLLGVISYQVQLRWVFQNNNQ